MRCGERATVTRAKKMSWFPTWVYWLVLVHPVVFGIVALIVSRRVRVEAPFCDRCKGHWRIRQALLWVSFLGVLALIAAFVVLFLNGLGQQARDLEPWLFVGAAVLFIGWLILLAIVHGTAIRPAEVTKTHFLLANVSEEFVQVVEEIEIERRVRLRQWEQADAEPAPPKRPSPEAIREERPPRPVPPDAFET
jgi:hypothetical protein